MIRLVVRLFLLAYFIMPLVSAALVVRTFAQIHDDVAPVYASANAAVTRATTALDTALRNLGRNFQPLVNTVNAIRSTLQTVVNFLRDTVYTLIDVVNGINVACSIGRTACIPKRLNVTLPTLIDMSFIDDISANINDISGQVTQVVTTTTNAITGYVSMLILAVVMFVAWVLLSYLLFIVFLYTGLWQRTMRARTL